MSMVDKFVLRYERLDGDVDELVSAELARMIERHANAMHSAYYSDHYVGLDAAHSAYEQFRKERGG